MKTFWNHTYDWLQKTSIKMIFLINKDIEPKKMAILIFPSFFIRLYPIWSFG